VVDHRDLARQDALDEPLGPKIDPSDAGLRLRPPQRPPEQAPRLGSERGCLLDPSDLLADLLAEERRPMGVPAGREP
jgi:hypothetical protein